jgi:hypothetical protein
MYIGVYSILLYVSALYFSNHLTGILVHKKNKRGKIAKLLLCCFDPSFAGEELQRYSTVLFEFLGTDSGVEDLCL